MIVLPVLGQVPKTFHQKFLFPPLGDYHVDLDLSVLSVSTCCAFMHLSLNPVSSMAVVKVYFRTTIVYQVSINASFEDI